MEVTVRRVMRVGREVNAYLRTIPEVSRFIPADEEVLLDGVHIVNRFAKKAGTDLQSYTPDRDIAHGGFYQALEIRDIIKESNTIKEAIEAAKQYYEKAFRECL